MSVLLSLSISYIIYQQIHSDFICSILYCVDPFLPMFAVYHRSSAFHTFYIHFCMVSSVSFQGSELLRIALRDSSDRVVRAAQHVFLPAIASWAYRLGKLEHTLINSILRELEELVKALLCFGVSPSFLFLFYKLLTYVPYL